MSHLRRGLHRTSDGLSSGGIRLPARHDELPCAILSSTVRLRPPLSVSNDAQPVGNEVLFVGSSRRSADQRLRRVGLWVGVGRRRRELHGQRHGRRLVDQGRRLYVGQSLWTGSQSLLGQCDRELVDLYSAGGPCYGVEMDAGLLWTLTPTATGTRQRSGSTPAGQPDLRWVIAQTASLTATLRERWGISPSGNLAAVPAALLGSLDLVDLDPASSTYLQVVASAPVTGASGLAFSMSAEVDAAEAYAYLLYAGTATSAIAVYDIAVGAFLDFDPIQFGQQDFVLPATVAVSMDVAASGACSGRRPGRRRLGGARHLRLRQPERLGLHPVVWPLRPRRGRGLLVAR